MWRKKSGTSAAVFFCSAAPGGAGRPGGAAAGSSQPFHVGRHLGDLGLAHLQRRQQPPMQRIGWGAQTVVTPCPLFSAGDQADPAEVTEVARRRRLRHTQDGGQIADADLPVPLACRSPKEGQEAQSGGIGKGPEQTQPRRIGAVRRGGLESKLRHIRVSEYTCRLVRNQA